MQDINKSINRRTKTANEKKFDRFIHFLQQEHFHHPKIDHDGFGEERDKKSTRSFWVVWRASFPHKGWVIEDGGKYRKVIENPAIVFFKPTEECLVGDK